ncbi:MAG: hypothetical protein AAF572_11660 [Cyanobacteria bacterium P01_B01_bin.77]
MAWYYAGTVAVSDRTWSQSIPVFSPQLRLTYASSNPTVLRVCYSGWLRLFYSDQGLYSERWERIWPKPQSELVILAPWEPELGHHQVQFRQGGRYLPVDDWSVTVECWRSDASSDGEDSPDEDTFDLQIGEALFTVNDTPVEFS